MVEQLDHIPTSTIIDKFANFTSKKILQLKLKLGLSIIINRDTLCGLSNSLLTSFLFLDARTIGCISDSLLSAINKTSQPATLISRGKVE